MDKIFVSENKCLNIVARVSSQAFNSKFLPVSSDIDNGIDGVIFWRENGTIVDSIYVQCKGGNSYLPVLEGSNYSERFRIHLPVAYVKKHYYIWKTICGPVIMVVCNDNEKAWWIDLKNENSYDNQHQHLYAKPENRFNKSAYCKINELVRHQRYLKGRARISINGGILRGCLCSEYNIKEVAHRYYKKLSEDIIESPNMDLNGRIEFTRVGWRHILRKSRRKSRILQSLMLLPLIPTIISQSPDYSILDVQISKGKNGEGIISEKLGIQAACEFNYRFPSIIQIILIRKKVLFEGIYTERIWFYSIYEMSRNTSIADLIIEQ